ncbi:MAG: class I SAM-dependent methyltransferase [Bacteriovoracaceae bacterium]|jgi:ubiquinone/menaquinone biosynthesis C-methylase UbiE|nr:hypothetical protein [Halobacteriovoraceae bacterium]MDP7320575.1 class I SAM-dependent methyltransferase [Bacteriovoracaceae bacterium]
MNHFNQVANDWDTPEKTQMMKELAKKTQKRLKLSQKIDIMDFGTGTGLFGLEFHPYLHTLTGIDTSQEMLNVFNKKTEAFSHIQSHQINLEDQSLASKFDLIISSMAFHHLQDPKKVLMKLKENLKQNGRIAIVDLDQEDGSFHPDNKAMGVKHFGFSKQELQYWAKQAKLNLDYQIINTLHKNETEYHQFLAIFY